MSEQLPAIVPVSGAPASWPPDELAPEPPEDEAPDPEPLDEASPSAPDDPDPEPLAPELAPDDELPEFIGWPLVAVAHARLDMPKRQIALRRQPGISDALFTTLFWYERRIASAQESNEGALAVQC
jgi:hypothetical protein